MPGATNGLLKSRRILRRSTVAAVVALIVASCVLVRVAAKGSNRGPSFAPPAIVPVETLTIKPQAVDLVRVGLGVVTAWNMATITPQVSGKLIDMPLPEGKNVRAGEVLALIDPKPFQATLEQAIAKKAQDEAQLADAKLDLKRYTDLVSTNAVTRQQMDTQHSLVAQLEAQVRGDQALIDSARIQLDYATIKAPFSGIVGIRSIDVGNVVSPGSPIVGLTEIEPISVVFNLPQADLGVLQASMTHGELIVLAYDQQGNALLGKGKLTVINNTIDQTTGTIKLKARFENQNHALWPGQFVQVRVVTASEPAAIAVPSNTVQRGPAGPYVWLVGDDSRVRIQPIELGQTLDGQTVIPQGVSAGDQVVAAGQFRLRQGSRVVASSTQPLGIGSGP